MTNIFSNNNPYNQPPRMPKPAQIEAPSINPQAPMAKPMVKSPLVSDMAKPSSVQGKIAGSFKKGGKVKKTGIYKLHKGEFVKKALEKHKEN